MRSARLAFIVLMATLFSGCGINNIPSYDEAVKAAWGQVQNEYQRRADLVPNLVNTVQGYATHERDTLEAVINARAKVTQMDVSPKIISDPAAFKAFEQNQAELSGALSRLMVVVERYPDLKANQNFLQLQSQLEGTENRISVARRDYVLAVQQYNTEIRTFPGRLWHAVLYRDMPVRESFSAQADAEKAPVVKF